MDSRSDTVTTPQVLRRRAWTGRSRGALLASGLPADVVQDAARRFGVVGAMFAVGSAVGLTIQETLRAFGYMSQNLRFERNFAHAIGIVVGLAAWAYARRTQASPIQLIASALLFEIATGFLLVFPEALNIVLYQPEHGVMGVSWLGVWVAVYPLVLPASPAVTVLAGLLTASMAPLAVWIVTLMGHPWPATSLLVYFFAPVYSLSFLTALPATLMHRMRREVGEARALGSYRLEERLGEGGMGEVWRASHRMLARPAAIKLIRSASAGASPAELEANQRRFELEAQTTASLSSPHTVALYDFGVADDGRFFYVMELLDGLNLEMLVREHGALPPERVVHLLLAACESLAEAHDRGLVHRDVKPSNLYTCRIGGHHDFLKVLDFGLVSAPRAAEPMQSKLTMQNATIGTPNYMAPEMVLGGVVDRRVDLYGLGCIGYWLLTGREVFEGRSPVEMMSRHAHAEPEPPSRHSANGMPKELENAILACLEKDPARRPATASDLARQLEQVPLATPWTEARAAAWWTAARPASG